MVDDSRVVRMRRRCWRQRERIDDCSLSNDWWSGELWIHLLIHVMERVIGAGVQGSNSLAIWQALMRLSMKMIAAAVFFRCCCHRL